MEVVEIKFQLFYHSFPVKFDKLCYYLVDFIAGLVIPESINLWRVDVVNTFLIEEILNTAIWHKQVEAEADGLNLSEEAVFPLRAESEADATHFFYSSSFVMYKCLYYITFW